MSGEYFCIEEVDPVTYFEEYDKQESNHSTPRNQSNYCRNGENDTKSNSSKRSQDLRLYEIEEQLEVAENRCNTLKGQLDRMKNLYQQGQGQNELLLQTPFEKESIPIEKVFSRKVSKRRPKSPKVIVDPTNKNRLTAAVKRQHRHSRMQEMLPLKSSSSSNTIRDRRGVNIFSNKPNFETPLIRQTPTNIMTDYSNGPTKTITKIVTGITANISQASSPVYFDRDKKKKHQRYVSEIDPIYEIPGQFSPRVEKRIKEQQRKLEELTKCKSQGQSQSGERRKMSTTSVQSKHRPWSSHNSSRTLGLKSKIQHSSGSLNITKPIKGKHADNATNLPTVRTAMLDDDSQTGMLARRRKRTLKRLRNSSKRYDSRKLNHVDSQGEYSTSDNLIELYHNCDVKLSDSEDNHQLSKTQLRQTGGGDLPTKPMKPMQVHIKHSIESNNIVNNVKRINQFLPPRMLTPINETSYIGYPEHNNLNQGQEEYMNTLIRNYQQPTISSKLKKVCKRYLRAFNVRQIPFCVAKSTSPSHNIGVNIQQVMSIIKTRQPITGISSTLAHNIGLAAGKLQTNPLSTLVSTLSTKMAYRQSHCPLMKTPMDYVQLQEIAKTIENEPYEIRPGFAGDGGSESALDKPTVNESSESQETKHAEEAREHQEVATWMMEPLEEKKCTCASQKGVPFSQVLSKYHMSTDCINTKPSNVIKTAHVPRARACKSAYGEPNVRKNRTRSWINTTNTSKPDVKKKKSEDLKGKEKSLKTVLANLYEEFDNLNNNYEILSKEVDPSGEKTSESTMKDLENLEKTLCKKEAEINMVMLLYTEVLALKDQVKRLRDRSQSSLCTTNPVKVVENGKEPAAAAHLTQLLRQIQNYQSQCN